MVRALACVAEKLPFAALPLLMNLLVWTVFHNSDSLFVFAIEDLAYLSIVIIGEVIIAQTNEANSSNFANRKSSVAFLSLLNLITILVAAMMLGSWRLASVGSHANGPCWPTVLTFVKVSGVCSGIALISISWSSLHINVAQDVVPSTCQWFKRIFLALLPCIVNVISTFWVEEDKPFKLFRPSDLCFFSIVIAGLAIVDLIRCGTKHTRMRVLCSLPLVLLAVWSSALLGLWYVSKIMEDLEEFQIHALTLNSYFCAITAGIIAMIVQIYVKLLAPV
jgi:hypothetical protein